MMKRDVLAHLLALVQPHRGRFLLVVFVTLLSTAASLIEPLIYREAVNDIAGLFVKHANDEAKIANGEELETGAGPLEDFLHQQIHRARETKPALPVPAKKRMRCSHTVHRMLRNVLRVKPSAHC